MKNDKTSHVNTLRFPLTKGGDPSGCGEAGDVIYLYFRKMVIAVHTLRIREYALHTLV